VIGISEDRVIQWLLCSSSPSIRYWALQDILGRPSTDPEVQFAQDDIMTSSCVTKMTGAMDEGGYWGKENDIYNPKYIATTHDLLILAELGAKPSERIRRSIEHVFRFQLNSGHFTMNMPKTERGYNSTVNDGCCYDGNILYYLIHFGYLKDSRTQRLVQFQVDYHSDDMGGWKCRAYPIDEKGVFPKNCFMGGTKVLKAFSKIPKSERSSAVDRIISQEAELILENQIYRYLRTPDGKRKEKAGWKRFGFPLFYQSDILEVLDTLTALGVKDERMQEAIGFVESQRTEDGTWTLRNTFNGKMLCDIEEKNRPSKWITLRAMRVLRRYYGDR
jgi:hypothetical protein